MTGAQHYAQAEELMGKLEMDLQQHRSAGDTAMLIATARDLAPTVLAAAQVHATLALAQATMALDGGGEWVTP